ncbi:MAG: hypothetical protein NT018_06320 [Armatimonadetes bacterium]|nr:hypothetical protein [Armatimonadota bacterium]
MNHRDYVLAAINHEQTDRVPYVLDYETEPAAELDAYLGSSDWRGKIQQFIATAAWTDTTVETPIDNIYYKDAFGSLWRGDRRPFHLEKPAFSEPSFDGIEWPNPDTFALHLSDDIAQKTGPNSEVFSVIYNGWGLFEMAWRLRGFENMLMDCIAEEDFFEELLDRLMHLRLAMVQQYEDISADAVFFGDDWGDQRGVIIGPERWRRFIKPRWAKIYDAVHAQGKYVINHCCGSAVDIIPDMIEIGLDVYESVQPEASGMNPFELKKQFGDKLTFWGCLGSQSTIQFGTPREIGEHIDKLCSEMGKGGGYILAPSKSMQPGTPPENFAAVIDAFTKQNL